MMTDTPADLAARCDELEAVVGRMTPGEWRRKKAYGTHVESAVDGGYQDSPTVVTTWSSSFAPPLDESVRNATGIVALRNTALPLIRQLRERLAAVEGAVSDWYCKACDTVFPDWGNAMRCTCGKGERVPSSFNQRRAERERDAAVKNANEMLNEMGMAFIARNKAQAEMCNLREENGRLRARIDAAMKHLPTDRDLTDTEAEIALELVEPVPLSEQRIAEIVEYATGRAAAPGKADDTPAQAD